MTIVPDVPPSNICIACHTRIYHTPSDHHNANNQMPIPPDTQFIPSKAERIKLGLQTKDASDALQRPLSSSHLASRGETLWFPGSSSRQKVIYNQGFCRVFCI